MASGSVCAACRQVIRLRCDRFRPSIEIYRARAPSSAIHSTPRQFSTSHLLSTSQPTPKERQPEPPPTKPSSKEDPSSVSPEKDQTGKNGRVSPEPTTTELMAMELRKRAPSLTETYVAYGVCEVLVKECARQADYTIPQAREKNVEIPKTKDKEDLGVGTGWWFDSKGNFSLHLTLYHNITIIDSLLPALGLTPTFNTWAQITFLHMYLLTCRLRCFPPANASKWHQHLLDHFFYIAEERMTTTHNIAARSIRNKYLKDLFVQWRGLIAGYDEGLIRGDAALATAVWRNVFKADENVDFRGVGEVVSYIRGVLKGLDEMSDEDVAGGEVMFGNPGSEREGVLLKSRLMVDSAPEAVKEPAKAAQA